MSLEEQLAQLRPFMSRSEVEAIMSPEEAERVLDVGNHYCHHGMSVSLHRDGSIESLTFGYEMKFSPDAPVLGVRIDMPVDEMQVALAGVALSKGETGEPNRYGFVGYQLLLDSQNVMVYLTAKDGKLFGLRFTRATEKEAMEWRLRQEVGSWTDRNPVEELANKWKSITDPNEMLLTWSGRSAPWNHMSDELLPNFVRELIATTDPDVWHYVALHWNWDYDHAVPMWIMRQKNCDKATALEIFFLADPISYFRWTNDRKSVPKRNLEMFDFLIEIRDRLARGFYQRSEIAFNGEEHMRYFTRGLETVEDKALAEKFFPREASMKIPGRDLTKQDTEAAAISAEMLDGLS